MRTTRLGALLASLSITTGTVAVLASGPAHAVTATTPVNIMFELGGMANIAATYHQKIGTIQATITYVSGGTSPDVTAGKLALQEKLPGKHWRTVRTDSDLSTISFGTYGDRAMGNVQYRLHYLGGTDGTTTWAPTYSYVISVRTLWNLHAHATCGLGGCRMYGKLSPQAKHHKVEIDVMKSDGTWASYKTVRTDSKSRWTAPVKATAAGKFYRPVGTASMHEDTTYGEGYSFVRGPGLRTGAERP